MKMIDKSRDKSNDFYNFGTISTISKKNKDDKFNNTKINIIKIGNIDENKMKIKWFITIIKT